jgi:hypothetical protein
MSFRSVALHHVFALIPCAQAVAADQTKGRPDISIAAAQGDCALLYCHLIADAGGIGKRGQ